MAGGRPRSARWARLLALATGLALVAASACSGGDDSASPGSGEGASGGGGSGEGEVRSGPPVTLRVLAGSELADLEPILADAAEATGVTVELTEIGTLEGVQQIVDGSADGSYDAIWFSSNRYLALHPEAQARIRSENRIMTSPVVLGLSADKAADLGWDGEATVTWSDIATAASDGRFAYGMTNPSTSNSGFSAVVGVTAALADTGAALEQEDIDAVAGELRGFFSAQRLAAGSSGWLADAFVARATGAEPGQRVDGLVNYESVLLSMNDGGELAEPLTLVYPSDGVITADYPLSLLDSASDEARDGYERLVDYLLTTDAQTRIMAETHRRPAAADVEPDERFGPASLVELPFPARLDVVDGLIDTYFNQLRRPVRTVYVLDVSGSMDGDRIAGLRSALSGLTGADDTLISRSQQFHSREEITLLPFDAAPQEPQAFALPEDAGDADRAAVRTAVEGLAIGGDTAVYDSLLRAYELLDEASSGSGEDDFATSIVLMTDGESNTGATFIDFAARHRELPEALRTVPVFTILFGEANVGEMERVAEMTGGRSFDARSGNLEPAFREIRGYQ